MTFWLEQNYTLEGERQHVSAPSSAVRRVGEEWKVAVFYAVPLPD